MTFQTKSGDTRNVPKASLFNPDGTVVDLTNCTVNFIMWDSQGELINKAAVIDNATGGVVFYPWSTGETDNKGIYRGSFRVTFDDGSTETFPNSGSILIIIE